MGFHLISWLRRQLPLKGKPRDKRPERPPGSGRGANFVFRSVDMPAKVIVITGPTATGKTALGAALALDFNGEVVSADSMKAR